MFGTTRKPVAEADDKSLFENRHAAHRDSERRPIEPAVPAPAPVRRRAERRSASTFIGPDLAIDGAIESKSDLHVEGEIQGDVRCKSIVIGESATVHGAIVAEVVAVSGRVTGPIYGLRVSLRPSCHVEGSLYHQSLLIEQGAYFEGRSRYSDDPIAEAAKSGSKPRDASDSGADKIGGTSQKSFDDASHRDR